MTAKRRAGRVSADARCSAALRSAPGNCSRWDRSMASAHLSIGREAAIVGMAMAAASTDQVITTHRCHGHLAGPGLRPRCGHG